MKIGEVLKDFVEECLHKLDLMSILQVGSSVYSKKFQDIDLIFFSKQDVFPSKDYVTLFTIIDDFEKKYKGVVFEIAAGFLLRKAKYKISIIPLQKLDLKLLVDPFFINIMHKEKNKKILFGKDPFMKPIKITQREIATKLILETNFALRRILDKKTKNEAINFLFKTTLRLMLSNEDISEKGSLLKDFKKIYPKIILPPNSSEILYSKIKNEDFKEVLDFVERCINFLKK